MHINQKKLMLAKLTCQKINCEERIDIVVNINKTYDFLDLNGKSDWKSPV